MQLARPRTRQPQWPTRVDWKKSITRGLVCAINPAAMRDAAFNRPLSPVGAKLVPRKSGVSISSDGSSTYAYVDLPPRVYTKGTIIVVTQPTTIDTNRGVVQFASTSASNPIFCLRTGLSDGSKVRLWLRGDDGGTIGEGQGDTATTGFALDRTSVIGVTFAVGGRYYAFIDGAKDSKSDSVVSSAFTLDRVGVGALSFAGGTFDFYNGATSLVLVYDRVLSDREIAFLSRNPWQIFAPRHLTLGAVATVQTARPIADLSNTGWVPSSGADLYPMVGETVRDDGTYIAATAVGAICELDLADLADPAASTGHLPTLVLSAPGGGGITIRLRQGTTTIATWTYHPGATPTEYTPALSGAEADSITDYTALRLQFEAIA